MKVNRKYGFTILPILFLFLSFNLQAADILWDTSHGIMADYNLEGSYSEFADLLRQNGYGISEGEHENLLHNIWDAKCVVISVLSNFVQAYSEQEIERLVAYVHAGGGLIVLTDDSEVGLQNVEALIEEFGFRAGQNNGVSDQINFEDHEIVEDILSIILQQGSAVDLIQEGVGRLLSTDAEGLSAIGINENMNGKFIIIGDGDIWTNINIAHVDNAELALNCFEYLERELMGQFETAFNGETAFVLPDSQRTTTFVIENTGVGSLEVGFDFRNETPWLSIDPMYAVIEANSQAEFTLIFDAADLPGGFIEHSTITVYDSDPEHQPEHFEINLTVLPTIPDHFRSIAPTGYDHSLLINELRISGEPARGGIEIGVLTENGTCSGSVVYQGQAAGLIARGNDPFTDEMEGFMAEESLSYRLWIPWENREIGAAPTYQQGPEVFRQDALSILELDGNPNAQLVIDMPYRWNLISSNVIPDDLDFESIFSDFVEDELLLMVKDGTGHFWNVRRNFSNLGDWDINSGYEVCLAHPAELTVDGIEVSPRQPIRLNAGWNTIGYKPQHPMPLEEGFASIADNILFAKQDNGAFYAPAWDWDGIQTLHPGKGYKVKTNAAVDLIYENHHINAGNRRLPPGADSRFSRSGVDNMSLLVVCESVLTGTIEVYTGKTIVGSGVLNNGKCGIAIWEDDPLTNQIDGAVPNQTFTLKLRNGDGLSDILVSWIEGEPVYTRNGFAVAEINSGPGTPEEFGLVSVYPNPFNSETQVRYSIPEKGIAEINLYDLKGRIVQQLLRGNVQAGSHVLTIDGNGLTSGLYILEFTFGDQVDKMKISLIK